MAYANQAQRTALAQGPLWTRIAELRAGIAERAAKYHLYRQTVNELGSLSDRDLSDLGLHRSMIASVARQAVDKA